MKKKPNPHWPDLQKYKAEFYKGDYLVLLETINETDSSITYNDVLSAFNNRSLAAEKSVKIKEAARALYQKRLREAKSAA